MATPFDLFTLDRADELIGHVRAAEEAWLKSQPVQIDMGMRWAPQVSRMRVFIGKDPQLDPIRHQVGDCVHNLRTTLEYLAMALVEAHTPRPSKPDQVQFPIAEEEPRFDKLAKGLREASPTAQSIARGLQPFAGSPPAAEHPLALLQRLSNFSKHKKPLSAAAIPSSGGIGVVRLDDANLSVVSSVRSGPFVSGDVIATYQLVATRPGASAHLDPAFEIVWAFANDAPLPGRRLVKTLESIAAHIRGHVVPALVPLLD